jgi:hypothetical protein
MGNDCGVVNISLTSAGSIYCFGPQGNMWIIVLFWEYHDHVLSCKQTFAGQ